MEINREQTLSIFCELVDRLRSKREFEIIEATYSRLRNMVLYLPSKIL